MVIMNKKPVMRGRINLQVLNSNLETQADPIMRTIVAMTTPRET